MSKIEEAVAKKILERSKFGEKKYKTTMERNDLSLMEWFQHLQEELMDACVYVEKLKQEVQYQEYELRGPCSAHDKQMLEDELICGTPDQEVPEEVIMEMLEGSIAADLAEIEREKRMNIIGQNGNTGEHYDTTGSVYVAVDNTGVSEWDNTNISSTSNISARTVYPGDAWITEETFKDDKETE